MFQSAKEKALNLTKKVLAPVAALSLTASQAFATTAEDITGAFSTGSTNLGLAVTGMIGMVAIVTGVGFIVSMLRK